MRTITRNSATVIAAMLLAGCDGFMGIGVRTNEGANSADVAVMADVRPEDNIISVTVTFSGPDTIYLTDAYLERREGRQWQWVDAGKPEALALYIQPISSAEDFTAERPIEDGPETLSSGEYRYRLLLFADRKMEQPLREEARTSNTFEIK